MLTRVTRWRTALVVAPPVARTMLTVAGLSLVVAVPLVVALGVLHDPDWLPVSDTAQMEMRIRDVASSHPPLIGAPGRFQGFAATGSHPGPMAFYLMWPVYWLLGSDGGGVLAGAAWASLVGGALALWVAVRRGGWRLGLGMAALLALLIHALGVWRMTDPWNPHMAPLWWVAFLLAVWSVLCDDWPMAPVAVLTGTYVAQAHAGYLPLVPPLLVLAVGASLWRWWHTRRARGGDATAAADAEASVDTDAEAADVADDVAVATAATGRGTRRWGLVALGILAVLWLPPLVEQVMHHPGNVAIIVESFSDPDEPRIQLDDAVTSWAEQLDASALLVGSDGPAGFRPDGSSTAGVVWGLAWAVGAAVAVRRRLSPSLRRLHLVVGVAQGLGLVATTRIYGPVWPYLTIWGWGTTTLMALALLWTAALVVSLPDQLRQPQVVAVALGAATLVVTGLVVDGASRTELPWQAMAPQLRTMAHATLATLENDPAGCGDDCRYLVTWNDDYNIGAQGFGLIMELERRGYDARAPLHYRAAVRPHRISRERDADAIIHVAVGDEAIDEARDDGDARELAYAEGGGADGSADSADIDQLTDDLIAALRDEGFDDEADQLADGEDPVISDDEDMSDELRALLFYRSLQLPPAAVFLITPAG